MGNHYVRSSGRRGQEVPIMLENIPLIAAAVALLGLIVAFVLYRQNDSIVIDNEKVADITEEIQKGAMAFLTSSTGTSASSSSSSPWCSTPSTAATAALRPSWPSSSVPPRASPPGSPACARPPRPTTHGHGRQERRPARCARRVLQRRCRDGALRGWSRPAWHLHHRLLARQR